MNTVAFLITQVTVPKIVKQAGSNAIRLANGSAA
jgi:hypothetical protein